MDAQFLPSYSLISEELHSLFLNRDYEINWNDVDYYFDTNCISVTYNRNIDPDTGGSANFLDENSCSKYFNYDVLFNIQKSKFK